MSADDRETNEHIIVPLDQPDATMPSPPGYELRDVIGRGGMGVIYRAWDRDLDREVAVKILQDKYAPTSSAAVRFVEEARITGQLQHPGIPAVYRVGTCSDGRPFLAMKLIKGQALDVLLKDGLLLDPIAVFAAISQAVAFAHDRRVIHRDLKPANVMVGSFGEVQVMDWGLAKVLASGPRLPGDPRADPEATTGAATEIRSLRDSDGSFTQAGSILGTPAFMPPEQAAGELDKIDCRSDVFGLGAILCVLLTGKPPFDGKDAESVRINAVRGKTDNAFARLDACSADPDVVALCKRCLAFEPNDRPATANDVAAAVARLRHAADTRAQQAERDKLSAEVRSAEQAKRQRMLQWAAIAVILMMAAGITVSLWQAKVAQREAFDAEIARRNAEEAWQAQALQKEQAEAARKRADATLKFLHYKVFAALRPKEDAKGRVTNVTFRDALVANLPDLSEVFADQPLIEAGLRMTLGQGFQETTELNTALEQYERAMALYTKVHGPDHFDTLVSTKNVARTRAKLNRGAEALPLIDEFVARVPGKGFRPEWLVVRNMIVLRCEICQKLKDPAGCRLAAEIWERQNFDLDSGFVEYDAACYRALAAREYANANQTAEATADADRAMVWLEMAVAAGWNDREHIDTDNDLDFLRNRPDFQKLVTGLLYHAPEPRPRSEK